MPGQHITSNPGPTAGIQVPFDLPDLQIIAQWQQADGTLTVVVEAVSPTARCVYCQQECHRVHDRRLRKKRDLALRTYPVELLLVKRRFRCPT